VNKHRRMALFTPIIAASAVGIAIWAGVALGSTPRHHATAGQHASGLTTSGQAGPAEQAAPAAPAQAVAVPAMQAPRSPLANHTLDVYLAGYDSGLVFRTAHWVAGGLDGGHYAVGKASTRLPLASAAVIRSAVMLCSGGQPTLDPHGYGSKACTAAQLKATLTSGATTYARIHVNAAGQIASVVERYVP